MNRRNFLGTMMAAGAALLAGVRGVGKPAPAVEQFPTYKPRFPAGMGITHNYPVPQSALTLGLIREAWNLHRPGKPFKARVVTDWDTFMLLAQDPRNVGYKDLAYRIDDMPNRFDVVAGVRVDILCADHSPSYRTAPFQDHVILDGEEVVAVICTRRVLPFDPKLCRFKT